MHYFTWSISRWSSWLDNISHNVLCAQHIWLTNMFACCWPLTYSSVIERDIETWILHQAPGLVCDTVWWCRWCWNWCEQSEWRHSNAQLNMAVQQPLLAVIVYPQSYDDPHWTCTPRTHNHRVSSVHLLPSFAILHHTLPTGQPWLVNR